MMVKASLPVRNLNLVVPLAHEATAMCNPGDGRLTADQPCTVSALIGPGLRCSDVDSTMNASALPGIRTSTTATRTTTTSLPSSERAPSADPNLFEQLAIAYFDCRQGKRNSRSALAFEDRLERNLCDLCDELLAGTYRPGRSICFPITRPRPREVWAAAFRDRIVHHLLYNKIAARIHATFAAASSACIPGRGTLYAAQRLGHDVRSITQNWSRKAWYLKLDLANFFVSIHKPTLFVELAKRITEPWWLQLAHLVLFHDPRQDVEVRGKRELLALVPAHKSLFNASPDHGLPIGNLSSQFFANVLLNVLDQHCKHQLRARYYQRYVDDFVFLHEDPQWLSQTRTSLDVWLPARLRLQLNPRKTILQPVERGVDFVGQVILPWRRTLRPRTLTSAMQAVAATPVEDLRATANSYFGLLRQCSHSHAQRAQLANLLRRRGMCVAWDPINAFSKGIAR